MKALMVAGSSDDIANADEINLFGYGVDNAVEAQAQASATEDATFSGLAFRVISGGSGTNTMRFRHSGANGNQTCAVAGTGDAEDNSNSDVLAAGDLFNIAYTDTGTNSLLGVVKGNVELKVGHGAFHGAANYPGRVHDAASATRYITLNSDLPADGNTATIANAQWKIRGYSKLEALQVRVTANARINDSVIKYQINGSDGASVITIGAGQTGLFVLNNIGAALSSGDLLSVSITLLTGVEDLTLSVVAVTLKSETASQDIWAASPGTGTARPASATPNYIAIGGLSHSTGLTEAQVRVKPGFNGVAQNLRCYLSANTYGGTGTLKLYKNGAEQITVNIGAGGGAGWYENAVDSVSFVATDELSLEFDEGTSGSITIQSAGLTLSHFGTSIQHASASQRVHPMLANNA